jgi:ribosomal protein S18 acetylase RimI-like enzyme
MTVRFESGAESAEKYHDCICRLYGETFSAPPFLWSQHDAVDHSQLLSTIRRDPTFDIELAIAAYAVIGFAYGYRLPVNHGWWEGFPTSLPVDTTKEWEGRTFALIDFAVDRAWRGLGIGHQLLDNLLTRRRERRAILSVQPTAVEIQQIYVHWGWCKVGQKGPIPAVNPAYWDIFVRSI